jgi:hypothetical protein
VLGYLMAMARRGVFVLAAVRVQGPNLKRHRSLGGGAKENMSVTH